jgi:hypothetical protein
VKRSIFLATLLVAISLCLINCGTGDKIGSVSMQVVGASGGTVNLAGLGGTLQLQVMANYTSGKQIDETNFATYTITAEGTDDTGATLPAPPYGMELSNTGLITATATQDDAGICTWWNGNTTSTALTTPAWAFTGDYSIVATYRGFTSNPVYIPVASGSSVQPSNEGQCGPSSSSSGSLQRAQPAH